MTEIVQAIEVLTMVSAVGFFAIWVALLFIILK